MITAMQHDRNLELILESGLIAVIRISKSEHLKPIIQSLINGGVKAIEITMTTPNALDVLQEVSHQYKQDCIFGAGTVLDSYTARAAILAGAQFVVSPVFHADVVQLCKSYSAIVVPGTYTPTEILHAWEKGADIVKVFPAPSLGPDYFKDVLAPLPQVRLLPTGVNLETIEPYIKAGAACLSAGATLISPKAVAEQDWNSITITAKAFLQKIKEARQSTL